MPIRLTCTCGKQLVVPEGASGPRGICPVCGSELILPGFEPIPTKASTPAVPVPPAHIPPPSVPGAEAARAALEQLDALLPPPRKPAPPRALRRFWLALAVAWPLLMALSYVLAGGRAWTWGTTLGVVVLLLGATTLTQTASWRELGLPYLGCLALAGSWLLVGWHFRVSTVEIEPDWALREAEGGHFPIRVFHGGTEVGAFDHGKKHTFAVRAYQRNRLSVQMLSPAGWMACPLDGTSTWLRIKAGPAVVLYIDNRGGGPAPLSCGAVQFEVPAGAQLVRTFLAPVPSAGYPLLLHGRVVGELTGSHHLVDVRGTRTYRLRKVTYGGLVPFLPRPGGDGVNHFQRQHLHRLPGKIDFFLTPAPERIQVSRLKGLMAFPEERSELLEAD